VAKTTPPRFMLQKVEKENNENNKLTEEINIIKQRIYSG
jgi:hypothetical protein